MSTLNESLSDSINLFQAIHVLQSKEDELALKKNDSSSGNNYDEKLSPQTPTPVPLCLPAVG